MINFVFNDTVDVYRRAAIGSASRDSLNNPSYGGYTAGLTKVYTAMPCRLAFTKKEIEFAPTGERVKPQGTFYYGAEFTLQHEDRVLTTDGIEYVVTSIQKAFNNPSVTIVDHYEATIELP